MSPEQSPADSGALLRLRVATDLDPAALPQILGILQNVNITPRRVVAELSASLMHIQIDVFGEPQSRVELLTGKISQGVLVHHAHWHWV